MHHKRAPTKFYQQDIVQLIASPQSYGIVLRCWHDPEDVPPSASLADPMMRQLQHGEVGVSFLADGGRREILPEADLKLVDRTLQPGDFCKRSIDDVLSGVITNVHVKGRIEHVISGEVVEGWKSLDDLAIRMDAEIGDYVIYDDWVGQVIELYDEVTVEVSGGQLVRLPELSSRLAVGERGSDIIPPLAGGVQNLFGLLLRNTRSSNMDTVIAVKHTVYAIAWLAVNQSLNPSDAAKRTRPERLWFGIDIGKLTMIRGRSDLEMRVGDRVQLKDVTGLPITKHGQEGDPAGVIEVQTFLVTQTETILDVLWQDGTEETLKSTQVIPYLNPDEYDCWPGDHVIWKGEDIKHPVIVQSVNAVERTARIFFPNTGEIELASVLDLDPHGTSDLTPGNPSPSDGLGVRRGDFVFIHPEGSTNGFEKPRVPRIGELQSWVRDLTSLERQLAEWRKIMVNVGADIATRRETTGDEEGHIKLPMPGDSNASWIGEVTNLNLDGTVEVTHGDWTVKIYPLERLTRLYDGIEQLEDGLWDEEMSDGHDSYIDDSDEKVWAMDEDGVWKPDLAHGEADEWEYEDDDPERVKDIAVDIPGWADEPDAGAMKIEGQDKPDPITGPKLDLEITDATDDSAVIQQLLLTNESKGIVRDGPRSEGGEDLPWKHFEILSSAPHDHAFFSSPPAQPSKSFLGRLTREYRILASSLPDSIIVRAYEDRTDLLRSLIIGSENTPYEDAPFVIDWMLDSNFPHSPPIAHFLSWTNGNGRVNPNLYEEGKVCLSILGTWSGDRNETWSASRSSLLQTFVSIQGLVLVKEPWFCEPAYEKLRGTEEGAVNSRLYNEKAYVLSRGFVRRALETPLGGLDSEIKWMYYHNRRLEKVVRDARMLVDKSKTGGDVKDGDQDLAVPSLTAGGIIALERTLTKLQAFLDNLS